MNFPIVPDQVEIGHGIVSMGGAFQRGFLYEKKAGTVGMVLEDASMHLDTICLYRDTDSEDIISMSYVYL